MSMETELQQARSLQQSGDVERAVAIYQQILAEEPGHREARHLLAVADIQRNDPASAIDRLRGLIDEAPGEARYVNNLGNAFLQAGDSAAAVRAFDEAAGLAPDNADYRANSAMALASDGRPDAAVAEFERALALQPENFRALHNLGSLLSKGDRQSDAQHYLQRAAAHPACQPETLINLATVCERLNRLDDVEACLARLGDSDRPMVTLLRARMARRRGDPAGALALLDGGPAHEAGVADEELEGLWRHETALACDLTDQPDRAFDNLVQAKTIWRRLDQGRDGAPYLASVRRRRARRWPAATADSPMPADRQQPVFFVGFPRSGTTLVEAMLDAHPAAVTTAESDPLVPAVELAESFDGAVGPAELAQVQARYGESLTAQFGAQPAGMLVVDKMPLNLVHVRLLDRFFPGARLLVALRDPRDVVLSCLMQHFERNPAMRCMDTLEETVALYEEVMGLWLESRDALGLAWLEYRYEDLIADPDTVLRRILAFLELPWDDALERYRDQVATREITTPSYRDVAEPLHRRGVERWRRYRRQLAPVLDRLEPFATAFGYPGASD